MHSFVECLFQNMCTLILMFLEFTMATDFSTVSYNLHSFGSSLGMLQLGRALQTLYCYCCSRTLVV